jgi:hypothetical protein
VDEAGGAPPVPLGEEKRFGVPEANNPVPPDPPKLLNPPAEPPPGANLEPKLENENPVVAGDAGEEKVPVPGMEGAGEGEEEGVEKLNDNPEFKLAGRDPKEKGAGDLEPGGVAPKTGPPPGVAAGVAPPEVVPAEGIPEEVVPAGVAPVGVVPAVKEEKAGDKVIGEKLKPPPPPEVAAGGVAGVVATAGFGTPKNPVPDSAGAVLGVDPPVPESELKVESPGSAAEFFGVRKPGVASRGGMESELSSVSLSVSRSVDSVELWSEE